MPNVFSRFASSHLGLQLCHAECRELSHTWNPNCFLAIWDALGPSLWFCFKTYGTLYLLKAVVDKYGRLDRVDWLKWLQKTIRSSLFLTLTEILFMLWLCAFRKLLGFATLPTISFVNGFLACAISIWIESKPRRAMLVPYLLNLASEALFRQAQHRHLIRPLPFGESLIFGFSMGTITLLLLRPRKERLNGNLTFTSAANFLKSILKQSHGLEIDGRNENVVSRENVNKLTQITKAIKHSARNFTLSFVLLLIPKLGRQIFLRDRSKNQLSWPSLRLPLFLGALPLLFQSFRFLFENFENPNGKTRNFLVSSLPMALNSSLSMAFFWPNNTLALYAFWKMVELIYYDLVNAGKLPVLPGGDVLLFCVVSSYLLSMAVIEPHALRPSYYKFLCSLTGNRLQLFNRPLFDKFFGTNASSRLHRNFHPSEMLRPNLLTINPAFYCAQNKVPFVS